MIHVYLCTVQLLELCLCASASLLQLNPLFPDMVHLHAPPILNKKQELQFDTPAEEGAGLLNFYMWPYVSKQNTFLINNILLIVQKNAAITTL